MEFKIYIDKNGVQEHFQGLTLHKVSFESVVMSLSDKITGDVLYKNNQLPYTMKEYVVYNGTKYYLKNPPTIVRNGMADSSEKGFTKYSFEFYHPSIQLFSIPFTDVAIDSSEQQYKAEDKTFQWIGNLRDFCLKINKNLENTIFTCDYSKYNDGTTADSGEMSEVLSFDNVMISDALKTCYDTFKVPFVLEDILPTDSDYYNGKKKYRIRFGKPTKEILDKEGQPFVFKFGQGLGLKNNSATPKNNKIVTRIAGQGSETNIPYGYPQIEWTGDKTWEYTINNDPKAKGSYPIYNGIVNGKTKRLIKHPFTRKRLMPSIFRDSVNKKVNPRAEGYDPTIALVDYYDADGSYTNPINKVAPSYENHIFEDIKPSIKGMKYYDTHIDQLYFNPVPVNKEGKDDTAWNDNVDEEGNYIQSYFRIILPRLGFDLYALAIENQPMTIAVESGECAGCKFEIQVDWEDWKKNFYIKNEKGELIFDDGTKTDAKGHVYIPEDSHRDAYKYPLSIESPISVIVKKDIETFGTILPNVYQQPKKGDEYVFLGISLPLQYILSKEKELDEEMKEYMRENNVYYFEYPLKFDEYFLAINQDILSQIRTNSLIRFEFAKEVLALSVKQISIRYGENPLPQYDITLTDDVSVVLNSIGQVTQGLSQLGMKVSSMQAYYNKNIFKDMFDKFNTKLSKNLDDVAHGEITFDKWMKIRNKYIYDYFLRKDQEDGTNFLTKFMGGIKSADIHSIDSTGKETFVHGNLEGRGYALYTEPQTGDTYLEVDNIVARKKFSAAVLDIQKETFSAGNINLTNANGTIFRVYAFDDSGYNYINVFAAPDNKGNMIAIALFDESLQQLLGDTSNKAIQLLNNASFFKIYFTRTDGDVVIRDMWRNGDMAFVKDLNLEKGQHSWHRVVTSHGVDVLEDGKEYNYIIVSNATTNIEIQTEKDDNGVSRIISNVKPYDDKLLNSVPQIGDKVVQYGSVAEVKRQGITRLDSIADGNGGIYVSEGIGREIGTIQQFRAQRTPIKITPNETSITADKIRIATRNAEGQIVSEDDFDVELYKILVNSYANKLNSDGTCSTYFTFSIGKNNSKEANVINVGEIKSQGFNIRAKINNASWVNIVLPSNSAETKITGSFENYSYIQAPLLPTSIILQMRKDTSIVDEYTIPIVVNGTNGKDGTSVSIKGSVLGHFANNTEFDNAVKKDGSYLVDVDETVTTEDKYHFIFSSIDNMYEDRYHAQLGDGYIDTAGDLWVAVEKGWENVGRIKGDDGKDGISYVGTDEYYQWHTSGTEVPKGEWTSNKIPTKTNSTYLFLWNKEVIHKSDGTTIETDPHVLSKDGKEVLKVEEYYTITDGEVPSADNTFIWQNTQMSPTTESPYLWNKEVVTYTDNTKKTSVHLLARRGDDGVNGENAVLIHFSPSALILTETKKNAEYQGLETPIKVAARIGNINYSVTKLEVESPNHDCLVSVIDDSFFVMKFTADDVTNSYLLVHATYEDINIVQRFDIYINRLGTWSLKVQDDTMLALSSKGYTYEENGEIKTIKSLSAIQQDAESITQRVSKNENDIKTNTSQIEMNAKSITSTVESINGLEKKTSEIKQTTDSISLKVKDYEGINLMVGTKLLRGERIFLYPKGDNLAKYEDFETIGSSTMFDVSYIDLYTYNYVSLKPSTIYSLSFMYVGNFGGSFDIFIYKQNGRVCKYVKNNNNGIVSEADNGNSNFLLTGEAKWKKGSVEFETESTLSETDEVIIIIGRIKKDNVNVKDLYIAAPKLEYGNKATDWRPSDKDTEADLSATGIDIVNKKITLTADKVEFKDNDGNSTALFEKDKLNINLIDVQQVVTDGLTAKNIVVGNATIDGLVLTGTSRLGQFTINKQYPYIIENGIYKYLDKEYNNNRDKVRMQLSHYNLFFDYYYNKIQNPNEESYQTILVGQAKYANLETLIKLRSHDPQYNYLISQRGIEIDVLPTPSKQIDDLRQAHNDAIYIEHGSFCGFRPRLRRISVNKDWDTVQLTKEDYTIIINSQHVLNIQLPNHGDIEDGQRIEICAGTAVDNHILCDINKRDALSDISRIEHNQMKVYIYDAINIKWWVMH